MKRIIRYLTRDGVDLGLLIFAISWAIKIGLDGGDVYTIGVLGLLSLYIMGVMWRVGTFTEKVNDNVFDHGERMSLGLFSYENKDLIYEKSIAFYIFIILEAIIMLIWLIFW